jgi:opacity protein-like surface antigen
MKKFYNQLFITFSFLCVFSASAMATTVEELERRLDLVTEELQELKNESAIISEIDYTSTYGFGPAASKVYKQNRGLSIGGYGEGHFSNLTSDKNGENDTADMLRAILYVGYKFSDKIVFNSEIELEHADEVYVEMASLDFLLHEKLNLRAGLLLTPVGITNELHEPTLFHGNDRPYVERQVLPSTWREMGVGAFGKLAEGLEYKLYLMNGFRGSNFDEKGLRGGRQKGSKAKADDWALVGKLSYEPILGLNLGGSFYLGDSGQKEVVDGNGNEVDVFTEVYEAHVQYKFAGLELKALGTQVKIDDNQYIAGATVPEKINGYYGEIAYDVMPLFSKGTSQYLAPFYRYESVDYSGSNEDVDLFTAGISYKPIPNVVLKADYRNFDKDEGVVADEVNFGFGYIF